MTDVRAWAALIIGTMLAFMARRSDADETDWQIPRWTSQAPISSIVFSPSGTQLWIASGSDLLAFEWPTLAPKKRLRLDIPQVTQLQLFGLEDSMLATGGTPGRWGEATQIHWLKGEVDRISVPHTDSIMNSTISPDRLWLATGGIDRRIIISDLNSVSRIIIEGHSKAVTGVMWLDANTLLSCSEDASLRIWSIPQANQLRAMEQHTSAITAMTQINQASPGGQIQVVTLGEDKTIRFWQPMIGRMMRFTRIDATPLAVTQPGMGTIVVVGDSTGRLTWIDSQTASVTRTLPLTDDWIQVLIGSPDYKSILVGTNSGKLYVVPNTSS